jgi:hypothetical protein
MIAPGPGLVERRHVEEPNHWHHWLLRERRQRPRCPCVADRSMNSRRHLGRPLFTEAYHCRLRCASRHYSAVHRRSSHELPKSQQEVECQRHGARVTAVDEPAGAGDLKFAGNELSSLDFGFQKYATSRFASWLN